MQCLHPAVCVLASPAHGADHRARRLRCAGGGAVCIELFESDADTLAQVTGSPHKELCGKGVFLHKKVGRGQVFFLGTVPDYDTMKNVVLPAVFEAVDLPLGGGDGSSFMVIPREGADRKGLILAEYAGKGGEYHLPAPMRSVLTDEILEGTVTVEPYDVILLETI